ncbi:MAG: GtrA family protein [Solirubrobacteraceae bacterium]
MREEVSMVDAPGRMVDVTGATPSGAVEFGSATVSSTRPLSPHVRVWHGIRQPQNWLQLIRFGLVGGSGFVLNLLLYTVFVHLLSIDYHVAAVLSWTLSAISNFILNRHWTFDGRHENARAIHGQGIRFLLVSLVALGADLVILDGLVHGGMAKIPAEAIAVACSMPLNFLGNKLWTFRHRAA